MSKSGSKEQQTSNYFWNNDIYNILFVYKLIIRDK